MNWQRDPHERRVSLFTERVVVSAVIAALLVLAWLAIGAQ
jgi:hypothetical protein